MSGRPSRRRISLSPCCEHVSYYTHTVIVNGQIPGVTCYYRYHGISAEGDDSEAAEHDAHQVEENTQLARLGPPLRELTRRSSVKTWRAQINETWIQNHKPGGGLLTSTRW